MSVVSVGVFDGLHLGHRAILERTLERAGGDPSVVVSFDPHPDVVLGSGFHFPAPLTPLSEKRRRLAAMGIGALDVLPFTREMASLSPEEFVERHLIERHGMRALVVGEDFALGRGRAGDVSRLQGIGAARGFEVEAVPLVERDGAPISSTRIRRLLSEGRVGDAARLLGRSYDLHAVVVRGEGIGRTLGFPTANLRLHEEKLVPADGIYAVRVGLEGERRPGAMSIGVRPTFGGQVRTLEVHVLDWSGDLVGRDLEVEFVDYLRPEARFENVTDLIEAIREDVLEARKRLATAEGPGA